MIKKNTEWKWYYKVNLLSVLLVRNFETSLNNKKTYKNIKGFKIKFKVGIINFWNVLE